MLYLIRHAQASYLTDNYDQLSSLGIEQANALAKYLANEVSIHHKYVGPHKRQQQTSDAIHDSYKAKLLPLPSPILLPELKEHSGPATLHHYKNKLIQEDLHCIGWHNDSIQNPKNLRKNSIKIFEYFIPQWMEGKYETEGLEDFSTFRKEISKGINVILKKKETDQNTAIISSAGSISTIIAQLTNIHDVKEIAKISFEILNASITSLQIINGEWQINKFNQVDHLSENMKTVV